MIIVAEELDNLIRKAYASVHTDKIFSADDVLVYLEELKKMRKNIGKRYNGTNKRNGRNKRI